MDGGGGVEAEVIDVGVVVGGIVVAMEIGGFGFDGAGIAPAMAFDVAVGKTDGGAVVVVDAGPIEEVFGAVGAHLNTKIRPANALVIDVNKGEKLRWRG